MTSPSPATGLNRVLYLSAGLVCVGVGGAGMVVPGLPSTVFFISAAACFTRSSPRLERWVLDLPGVGQMVRDHRAGLGMPRRAKVVAISLMWAFSVLAAVTVPTRPFGATVLALAAVGTWYIARRVPTREHELARRGLPPAP